MRVVVTGATGNVGTSVVRALAGDPAIDEIVGLARRRPRVAMAKTRWVEADVLDDDLARHFEGAGAVIHLAWLIQPSRDREVTHAVNVAGSANVFSAAAAAGVPRLVVASSVGAYSKGHKDRAVDEGWPTGGIPTSFYSRDKADQERLLDEHESRHPEAAVVRLRPGLIFKGEAATEIRRLFAGPFLVNALVRPRLIPAVPDLARLRFQAVHTSDVAEAYRLAVVSDVSGPFNIAAEPVLDPPVLAELLQARRIKLSPAALRRAADLTWRMRLQPTPAGWVDLALGVPLMDTSRARDVLGWIPSTQATDALLELLDGICDGRGFPTPPLDPETSGRLRLRELRTGIGARTP
jgi:nucleoside-diphosphate-sugar epimerase